MTRRITFFLALLGALALFAGVNLLAEARLGDVRADLTQQQLYTLSRGTRAVLRGLKDPITLRLYYSRRLGTAVPSYGTLADHVREMLAEYVALANGKLHVEVLDPEPYSDTEDRAIGYGLQGVPLDQSGEQVYFGLVGTNLLDDERSVAFFRPERERFLEYDLTKLIYDLSNPQRPMVGIMSSLPLDGDPRQAMIAMRNGSRAGQPWMVMQTLRETDNVRIVPLDVQVIPADIQVLLVAQAQALSDEALYAIDQFVMRGGRLMVMVDPQSEAEAAASGQTGPGDNASNLARLFDVWGITFDPAHVVGDLGGAWRVRGAGADRSQAVDYVPWFNIRDGIARDDPATADLQQVTVASAGVVGKRAGTDITFTPLLTSGPQSGLIPVEEVRTPDPTRVLAAFKAQGGPRVIAARIRGVLHSAFAEAPPADSKPRPADFPAHRANTEGPANLVVVGDSDILADRFWVRVQDFFGQPQATPFSDNGAFVANLIGTLAGGDTLIGLRSRSDSIRPFDRVDDMQKEAEARFRATERTLQTHLDETEKKLRDLREGHDRSAVVTAEQRAAIDAARGDILATRQELRRVQLDLNRDIGRLQTELQIANIVAVPAILTLIAIGLGFARRRARGGR